MNQHLAQEIEEALEEQPVFDAHTHLIGNKLGAEGLHDILLYHMVISDLYAAGCPSGGRLTPYPGCPSVEEQKHRIEEALPYLPFIQNTSMAWLLRIILAELYDWHEPLTIHNWQHLDQRIREQAQNSAWAGSVLSRANIARSCTELARREKGEGDHYLQYALEWAFFTRSQWGEFDTALYELERCWGLEPQNPTPIGSGRRPKTQRVIQSLDDVHEAVQSYVDHIPYQQILSMATHISTDIDYTPVDESQMADALLRRGHAGLTERNIYASYVNELFLKALEKHAGEIVFQFSFGAEPLPYETGSRLLQHTIAQVGEIIARHPKLRFQCFLASRHANQSLCTLARELPNLSLSGYWWHNFFPDSIEQIIHERLDMLPVNKQIGFFSDAYCVEWSYAKARLVRKKLAKVLADKIESRQYDFKMALDIARATCYESPQTLLGMEERRDKPLPNP